MPKQPNSLIQVAKVVNPSGTMVAIIIIHSSDRPPQMLQVSVQVALDLARDLTVAAKECSS